MPTRSPRRGRRRLAAAVVDAIELLVHSNAFVAIAATSVAVSTTLLVDRPLDPVPLFVVFAATLFVYSCDRVTDLEEDARNLPGRAAFTRRYGRGLFLVGCALYLLAVALGIGRALPRAEFLAAPPVVVALYSLAGAKRILLVKNLLVGLAWGAIPLGVGAYYGDLRTVEIWFLFAVVTTMLTVAAAIFDIKDVEGDRAAGVRTLPIVVGPRCTRVVAAAVAVGVSVGIVVAIAAGVVPRDFLVLLGFTGYVLAYVPFATRDRGALFYGFVVDGEHVALALLVVGVASL